MNQNLYLIFRICFLFIKIKFRIKIIKIKTNIKINTIL